MPIQTVSQAASNQNIPFGGRNVIINGDMKIWQRATSKTGVSDGSYETVDRFKPRLTYSGGSTNVTKTRTTLKGFPNALRYDHTGSTATVSGAWYAVRHVVEKGNCYGIARAGAATLSFWYKSNRTGSHYATCDFLYGGAFTGSHLNSNTYEFNVSVADVWQKYEYTFLVDLTDNGSVADNGIGFGLSVGINTEVSGVPTVSTTHYFEITGIQLEAGTMATQFEHRPYGAELQLCQRYFFATDSDEIYNQVVWGMYTTGNVVKGVLEYPVEMRSKPSISSGTGYGNYFIFQQGDTTLSANGTFTGAWSVGSSKKKAWLDFAGVPGGTQGYSVAVYRNGSSANSVLWASSEL